VRSLSVRSLLAVTLVMGSALLFVQSADAITLTAPADGQAVAPAVALRWSLASDENALDLLITPDCLNTTVQIHDCWDLGNGPVKWYGLNATQTSLRLPHALTRGHVYYWQVDVCSTPQASGTGIPCDALYPGRPEGDMSAVSEFGIQNPVTVSLARTDVADTFVLEPPKAALDLSVSVKGISCRRHRATMSCKLKDKNLTGTAVLRPSTSGKTKESFRVRPHFSCYLWDQLDAGPCRSNKLFKFTAYVYQICDATSESVPLQRSTATVNDQFRVCVLKPRRGL
jgi:hypothetical protein